jgi:hypothetical protein
VPAAHRTSRAARKETARRLVSAYDLAALESWASAEPRAELVLQALLYDGEDLIGWRAVEALGRVAAVRARGAVEPVREILRRVLWLMNDESGGLLRAGPQVMGSVLAHVPALRREFGTIVASFLEEEPFRVGTRWGLWRLAAEAPDVVAQEAERLAASCADPDPAVRGHAAAALRAAGGDVAAFARDEAAFTLFDHRTGELRTLSVADVARAP